MSEVQILSPRPILNPLSPNKIKGFRQIGVVGLYKHLRHFTSKRWGTRWGTKWGTENQGKLALYGAKGARRGFCGRGRKFFTGLPCLFNFSGNLVWRRSSTNGIPCAAPSDGQSKRLVRKARHVAASLPAPPAPRRRSPSRWQWCYDRCGRIETQTLAKRVFCCPYPSND